MKIRYEVMYKNYNWDKIEDSKRVKNWENNNHSDNDKKFYIPYFRFILLPPCVSSPESMNVVRVISRYISSFQL